MTILPAIDAKISRLETALARETAIIEAAIQSKQIGKGYWEQKYRIEQRLKTARALRDAVAGVMS